MLAETLSPDPSGPSQSDRRIARAERRNGADRLPVAELQARIRGMQATTLDSKSLPTAPDIAALLPGGALKEGSAYSVAGSTTLAMTLLSGPSAAGAWCAVVGVPNFGAEAAARCGIVLERLALVPSPGDQWLTVTAALVDVMGAVLLCPPARASDAEMARLNARLRQRGTALIVLGDWPQSEARLELHENSWRGLGDGHGYLTAHEATVSVVARAGSGRPRTARLQLSGGSSAAHTEAASRPELVAVGREAAAASTVSVEQRSPRRVLEAVS